MCLSNTCIKIEPIRGKTVSEIYAALYEMCGMDTMDNSSIQRWQFQDGRIRIDNNPDLYRAVLRE